MRATSSKFIAPSVHLSGLTLTMGSRTLLENTSIALQAGQWTCLLGQSGSGKSTLLRFLCGLLPEPAMPYQLTTSNDQPLANQIVWMAQQDLLLPWMTVLDNVQLGGRLRGDTKGMRRHQVDKARSLLSRVGLDNSTDLYPHELSGGMRQRAALARTLMQDKPVCLLDEPFSSVDAITRHKLQSLAHELLAQHTVLLVTHDPLEAVRCGHRLHVLSHKQRQVLAPIELPGLPLRGIDSPQVGAVQSRLLSELADG